MVEGLFGTGLVLYLHKHNQNISPYEETFLGRGAYEKMDCCLVLTTDDCDACSVQRNRQKWQDGYYDNIDIIRHNDANPNSHPHPNLRPRNRTLWNAFRDGGSRHRAPIRVSRHFLR